MNKALMLKIVNSLLGVSFLAQVVTGVMMKYGILTDYMAQTVELHEYNGVPLVLLGAAHLLLNWSWVKMTFFKKKPEALKV